jgi:hypothetical protein
MRASFFLPHFLVTHILVGFLLARQPLPIVRRISC